MTISRKAERQRRKTTLNSIPRNIQQWFAGERQFTFYAYTYPYTTHLREYWEAYKKEHPKAIPPANLEAMMQRPAYPSYIREDLEDKQDGPIRVTE